MIKIVIKEDKEFDEIKFKAETNNSTTDLEIEILNDIIDKLTDDRDIKSVVTKITK